MNVNVTNVLGSEYTESIEREIKKLKQSDQLMLGDIIAIIKRSDSNLGRPIEECNPKNEGTYVIFAPTKYSIVCHKDVNTIRNEGSEFIFMSLNSFAEQLLEFNFTYLQIMFCGDYKYATLEYYDLMANMIRIMSKDANMVFHKGVSTIASISKDILSGKIKDSVVQDRAFFMFTIYNTLYDYLKLGNWKFHKQFEIEEYEKLITFYTKDKLESFVNRFKTLYDFNTNSIDIEELKKNKELNKINNKYTLLKKAYSSLETEQEEN